MLLQTGFSWAEDEERVLEGSRVWKAAAVDEFYTEDWHDPRKMSEHAEDAVGDEEYRENFIVSGGSG